MAYKFAKTDNMTPTNFFPNIFNMDIKKCRIWCRFQTIEKVSRMFTQRKLECWELMYSVLKVHHFYTFMLITFLYEFFTLFSICNRIQFCIHPWVQTLNFFKNCQNPCSSHGADPHPHPSTTINIYQQVNICTDNFEYEKGAHLLHTPIKAKE